MDLVRIHMPNRPVPIRVLVYAIATLVGVSILWGLWAWVAGGGSSSTVMTGGARFLMPLMMLVPVLLVVLLVYALAPGAHPHTHDEDAGAILERRYARGEVSREEYLRMKEDLAGGRRA